MRLKKRRKIKHPFDSRDCSREPPGILLLIVVYINQHPSIAGTKFGRGWPIGKYIYERTTCDILHNTRYTTRIGGVRSSSSPQLLLRSSAWAQPFTPPYRAGAKTAWSWPSYSIDLSKRSEPPGSTWPPSSKGEGLYPLWHTVRAAVVAIGQKHLTHALKSPALRFTVVLSTLGGFSVKK